MITCVHYLVRMRWVPHHLEAACQIALEKTPVTVVSDDTDVFLLLLHFTETNNIDTPVYMEATKGETNRSVDAG